MLMVKDDDYDRGFTKVECQLRAFQIQTEFSYRATVRLLTLIVQFMNESAAL